MELGFGDDHTQYHYQDPQAPVDTERPGRVSAISRVGPCGRSGAAGAGAAARDLLSQGGAQAAEGA